MNVQHGERTLIINSNCRAFVTDRMDWCVRLSTFRAGDPREYTWYQLAVLRVYSWVAYRPAQ